MPHAVTGKAHQGIFSGAARDADASGAQVEGVATGVLRYFSKEPVKGGLTKGWRTVNVLFVSVV
jgi:hypothetical protein